MVASYVLGQYVKENDLIRSLSWLTIAELMQIPVSQPYATQTGQNTQKKNSKTRRTKKNNWKI